MLYPLWYGENGDMDPRAGKGNSPDASHKLNWRTPLVRLLKLPKSYGECVYDSNNVQQRDSSSTPTQKK